MNFDNYKFRCSSLGYIMSAAKGKSYRQQYDETFASMKSTREALEKFSDKALIGKAKAQEKYDKLKIKLDELDPLKDKIRLSDSAKTHLADIYTIVHDGRKAEDIKSKYLEKGLHMEEDAITLYSLVTGIFHKKSEEYKENDYICGHIDFPTIDDTIVDTKCNWSIWQFNRVKARPMNPMYIWQGRGYMWLWEKNNFELSYCLLNTPEHLIAKELLYLEKDFIGSFEDLEKAKEELRHNHIYDDMLNEDRLIRHKLERELEYEEQIKKHVIAAREYLNNFGKKEDVYEEED